MERIQPVSESKSTEAQKIKQAETTLGDHDLQVVDTQEDFKDSCAAEGNIRMRSSFRSLEEQKKAQKKSALKEEEVKEEIATVEEVRQAEEVADRFSRDNYEFNTKMLLALRYSISQKDSVEEIVRKILDFYPDYTLADEALNFLMETSSPDMAAKFSQAKEYLNAHFKREITAGKNIKFQAQEFSKQGLGSPSDLRNMYREITGNPKTPHTLFEELSQRFNYETMKMVMRFLLHSLGTDLKAKGPSITRPELQRLMEDVQILQAILGVYRFFKSRNNLLISQFEHFGLNFPKILTFEALSKFFMKLTQDKYVSPDKVKEFARLLNLTNEELSQIIVFTQIRDATRNTSSRLYRSNQHRQEVLQSVIEALQDLEDELEAEEG
ncbi:MAG: type III secretion system gatekeeper subunit SctW [Chlamydiae bacterium]|nr:type III secretion system gatekeeper subunit SctW [Chlamydiota bacterium]